MNSLDRQQSWLMIHLLSSPRQVSYFEIYLDKIRDLLDGETKCFQIRRASVDEAPDWTSTSWCLEEPITEQNVLHLSGLLPFVSFSSF